MISYNSKIENVYEREGRDPDLKHIQSATNPKVKQWKKLLTKKERDKTGLFLVEGFHLVEEAVKASRVEEIILLEDTDLPSSFNYGATPITMIPKSIFVELSDTQTPQGILGVCSQPPKLDVPNGQTYLLIDAVQDPGNLGTMIRTADAAGIDVVVVGEGSVDTYNPKVLRSAQGSHFHLPVVRGNIREWVLKLQEASIPVYGTALEGSVTYQSVQPSHAFALMVGNEGGGVDQELLQQTDANLFIPIYGKSESLNVAVATGILLYYLRTHH